MDTPKELQKIDKMSVFIDNQNFKTNPFGENRVGERAYRRAERLASALTLITNHVSDNEPLKHEIRRSSLQLLVDVLALKDEMRSVHSMHADAVRLHVRQLISYVRLLAVSGHISFQNSEILCEALDELPAFLSSSQRSILSESIHLSREDLLDVHEYTKQAPIKISHERSPDITDKPIKDIKDVKGQDVTAPKAVSKSVPNNGSSRARAILEVLKTGGNLGIRDIASNLPEYSEKMIQRELVVLVDGNQVKKEGSKRWSRYSFLAS